MQPMTQDTNPAPEQPDLPALQEDQETPAPSEDREQQPAGPEDPIPDDELAALQEPAEGEARPSPYTGDDVQQEQP